MALWRHSSPKKMEEEKKKKMRRYAVLLCAEDSDYVRKVHGGYFEVFVRLLHGGVDATDAAAGEEGDEDEEDWEFFRTFCGELPGVEAEIESFDGFVVTGSCSDAHGDDDWILALVDLLRRIHALRKKILGICFGHQILCRALGGKTGRAKRGWDIGVTTVDLSGEAVAEFLLAAPPPQQKKELLCRSPSLSYSSQLAIIECHRDEVWELPEGAVAAGRSKNTAVEAFRYGEHVMGLQGHPEYTKDILLSLVDRLLRCNFIQDDQAETVKASLLKTEEPDREAWRRICRGFLKGKTHPSLSLKMGMMA